MATVRARKRKKGTVYIAEMCVSGIRKTATFDTKSQAHPWAEQIELLLAPVPPRPRASNHLN